MNSNPILANLILRWSSSQVAGHVMPLRDDLDGHNPRFLLADSDGTGIPN